MSVGISIKVLGTLVELALPYILSHILKNVVVKEDIGLIVLWGVVMIFCAGGRIYSTNPSASPPRRPTPSRCPLSSRASRPTPITYTASSV